MILTSLLLICLSAGAQTDSTYIFIPDTAKSETFLTDTIQTAVIDTGFVIVDSLAVDTLQKGKEKKDVLEDEVFYSAVDSMIISVKNERMFLYGQAKVKYQDIDLEAGYIEFDMKNQEVFACGKPDSTGNMLENPKFKQGQEEFESDSLKYNFKTKKGLIYRVITEQGEGKLHGDRIKRHPNGHIHVGGGKYSTCDLEHPHFYLKLTKAIVIPDDKIVSGPAYMVMEDIPLPMIGLPFGFFPNSTTRSSGIIIPSYGEERTRGFYLQRGGWYQVLGDYADLRILGDLYSKGSWAVEVSSVYTVRYRFRGKMAYNYSIIRNNDDETTGTSKLYRFTWNHSQDAKANPTRSFSASVNYSSSEYDKQTDYYSDSYLNVTKNSGINYSKRWPGTPFSLSMSANVSQNTKNKTVTGSLPTGSFGMDRIYPFRSKAGSGKYKWYENVSLSYKSKFTNNVDTYDSLFFERTTWENSKKGFEHSVPLSVNFKIGQLITISPSLNYNGVIYDHFIHKYPFRRGFYSDSIVVDTINGLVYGHAVNPSISAGFTPKLYGMFISKKENSYVQAVRHVIKPGVSASYTPDMGWFNENYYQYITYYSHEQDTTVTTQYSYFEGGVYGTPSISGQSASVSFSLGNNVEMKVLSKNDTTGEPRKVSVIDNLNFNTTYNPLKEEFKWSDVTMSSSTSLFNRKLSLTMHGNFSPYALDSTNNIIDKFLWVDSHRKKMFRMTNLRVSWTLRLSSAKGSSKEGNGNDARIDEQTTETYDYMDDYEYGLGSGYGDDNYVDFDIPWSLNVSYSWSRTKPRNKVSFSNTVEINGDFSLTKKWKFSFRTGYDIIQDKMSFTRFSIHRDLHCWDMNFSVIPFGQIQSYNFEIRARASLLKDLKIDKKQSFYDRY